MKILLIKSIINLKELKELKINNTITYNSNKSNIDLVITDTELYFYKYKEYCIDYTHWLKDTNLAFIVSALEETLSDLASMNF